MPFSSWLAAKQPSLRLETAPTSFRLFSVSFCALGALVFAKYPGRCVANKAVLAYNLLYVFALASTIWCKARKSSLFSGSVGYKEENFYIIKSRRFKGIAYIEFRELESVTLVSTALKLRPFKSNWKNGVRAWNDLAYKAGRKFIPEFCKIDSMGLYYKALQIRNFRVMGRFCS